MCDSISILDMCQYWVPGLLFSGPLRGVGLPAWVDGSSYQPGQHHTATNTDRPIQSVERYYPSNLENYLNAAIRDYSNIDYCGSLYAEPSSFHYAIKCYSFL